MAVCGAVVLGAGVLGLFAATSRAGSQGATFELFVAPDPVTRGERTLITAKFTNGPTGTVNHVEFTIEIDEPLSKLTPLEMSDGCTITSPQPPATEDPVKTTISCDVGQIFGGVRETRYVTFTAGSDVNTLVTVTANATFDEQGAGGGKKNVVPGESGTRTDTTTVAAPSSDQKGGCTGTSGTVATSGGGTSNIDTTVAPSNTTGLCTPVLIQETALPPGATCEGSPCTTAGSFVTFPGIGTVSITFSFPPPGNMPQTLPVYQFANNIDPGQDGTLVDPCGEPVELPCVQKTTRIPNLRQIVVDLLVFGGGVDPGFAG